MNWQPRYVAYAKSMKMTPEEASVHDDNRWPGGCMTGFILWMHEQSGAFAKHLGIRAGSIEHQSAKGTVQYTEFLERVASK